MWNPFKKKEVSDNRVTYVVPVKNGADGLSLRAVRLRQGMWVVPRDMSVGIVQNAFPDGTVVVMLVDEKGLNLVEVIVHYTNLRQAKVSEIPGPRRPLDLELASKQGYV